MSLIKNMNVDEYINENITNAPSKKLKKINMLKSRQRTRRDSVGKTQIDCSQKSKYPCNALKRRLDTSEDMEKDNQLIKKVELFELSCKVLEIASTILENALKLNSFSKC